jgi:hypothetical protein
MRARRGVAGGTAVERASPETIRPERP